MDTPVSRPSLVFPKDFIWGTATSAYQIEGSVEAEGRQDSIWDVFCRQPGAIFNGENGDLACEHFREWEKDVILMSKLGLKAYRFSLAWSRIIPEGQGNINQEGLDFYDKLIDTLLKHNIIPFVTLYHWDLPQKLQEFGGWASRAITDAFVSYALVCFNRFKDRVKHWMTLNEPWIIAMFGYCWGIHAPGIRDTNQSLMAMHHLLLSHGMAIREMRASDPYFFGKMGIALNINPVYPENLAKEEDVLVAKQHRLLLNDFLLDAIYLGKYPQEILEKYPILDRIVQKGDMELINTPTDFLGINYYTRSVMRGIVKGDHLEAENCSFPNAYSTMMWEFYPEGLKEIIEEVWVRYHPKEFLITENGTALDDEPTSSGEVLDDKRIEYIQAHLQAVHCLLEKGIPITGYFVWSLLDNFEWTYGYHKRFGLIYVDFTTLKRTFKKSANWFGHVSQSNELPLT